LLPIYASEVTTRLLPLNGQTCRFPNFVKLCPTPVEFQSGLVGELFPQASTRSGSDSTNTRLRGGLTRFYTGDFFLSNSRLVEGYLEELRGLGKCTNYRGMARLVIPPAQPRKSAERINQAIAASYSVLPTPTLGLGQGNPDAAGVITTSPVVT